jgi:SAM-dependent methyltransferase
VVTAARTWMWRAVYEALGARVRTRDWAFMNYGYAPDDGPVDGPVDGGLRHRLAPTLDPADEPDRLCIQLYDRTLDGLDLSGRDVLEIGSGRGGGAQYLARYGRPRTVTGIDFSRTAVRLSRRHRSAPALGFRVGDAQATGLPDASVDVVVNVESSHCYGSMEAFVREVHRVLRPGGHFVWADLRGRDDVDAVRRQLSGSGLEPVAEEDLTAGVLRAMRLDSDRKAELVRAWIPRPFRRAIRPFAGLEGTRNYVGLGDGSLRYLRAHLVKPQVSAL